MMLIQSLEIFNLNSGTISIRGPQVTTGHIRDQELSEEARQALKVHKKSENDFYIQLLSSWVTGSDLLVAAAGDVMNCDLY